MKVKIVAQSTDSASLIMKHKSFWIRTRNVLW